MHFLYLYKGSKMKGQFYIFFVFLVGVLVVLNIFLFSKQTVTNFDQTINDDTVLLAKDFEQGFKYYRSYGIQGNEFLQYITIYIQYLKERNYNLSYRLISPNCINYTIYNAYYSYSNVVCAT